MVDRDEVPPSTQATFDAGVKLRGKVLDGWRVVAHNPAIFDAYLPFLQAVFSPQALDHRTMHLSAVRATLLNHCRYSLSHRVDAARKQGIPEEDLIALVDLDDNRDRFSAKELAALDFTDELTTRVDDVSYHDEPLGVTADTLTRVGDMFSDAELVELTMSVALWNLLTRFTRVMDFDLDMEPPPPEMDAAI
jgi:alkylhydroperoxidase family enzyme